MKMSLVYALIGAALAIPAAAFAGQPGHLKGAGHYEWQAVPQYGPRAMGSAQKRVWVADNAQMADCDCGMMKTSADDCMKEMQRGHRAHIGKPAS